MFKIYNDDAFKAYEFIKDKADLVLTDPPYNISQKNNFSTMKNPRKGLDFGEWDKNFNLNWVKQLDSLTNSNATVIIFVGERQISDYIKLMEENNFIFKNSIRWIKTNPMPRNINRRYVLDYEYALLFVKKGAKWIFNVPKGKSYLIPEIKTGLVSNIIRIHPTQKHIDMLKELILVHSNENDVVLDLFMGSGSTGVACLELNRKFIGIEKDKNYFENAENWLGFMYGYLYNSMSTLK